MDANIDEVLNTTVTNGKLAGSKTWKPNENYELITSAIKLGMNFSEGKV
jgi:hypothetical protein